MEIIGRKLTNRQLKAIETKKQIRRAANALFVENDFEDVLITDICAMAGVSVGSFYNYYKSKEDLIASYWKEFDDNIIKDGQSVLEAVDLNNIGKILALLNIQLNTEKNYRVIAQFYRLQLRKGWNTYLVEKRPLDDYILRLVDFAKENGELDTGTSSSKIAAGIMKISRTLVFDWVLRNGSYDLYEQAKEDVLHYLTPFMPHI